MEGIIYYVYVLRSLKTGYRYVGQTTDIGVRLIEHNSGLTKSIRFQIPFIIIHTEQFATRKEAIQREHFLKSGQGREWLDRNIKK